MEQPRAAVRGDRFWRGIAVAVVVLIASSVGVVAIDSLRTWRKDDQAAAREAAVEQQRIAAEQQHLAAERQRQQELATAEGQRRDRAALVRAEVQSHPERMQTFAVGSTVRVRSSAPQELLRGLACSVFSKAPVRDEESGEVWMLNYSLYVLPLLQIDGTLDLTPVWVAAEHLAAAGAAEETEDLRRNPVLAKRAAEQAGGLLTRTGALVLCSRSKKAIRSSSRRLTRGRRCAAVLGGCSRFTPVRSSAIRPPRIRG